MASYYSSSTWTNHTGGLHRVPHSRYAPTHLPPLCPRRCSSPQGARLTRARDIHHPHARRRRRRRCCCCCCYRVVVVIVVGLKAAASEKQVYVNLLYAPSVCADISCWLTSKLCRPRTTNVKFGLPQRASLLTNLSSGPWKFKLWITVFEEEEAEGATNFDGIFAQFKWPETCFQLKCCNFLLPSSVNRLGDFLHFGQPFKAGGNNYLTQIAHIC